MTIKDIMQGINVMSIAGSTYRCFSNISYDSRKIGNGDLFVAIKGVNYDGHSFINDAISKGASAILYDGEIALERDKTDETTFAKVEDSRSALSYVSSLYYGEPSKKLRLIGITGTNGKTTMSYIIKSILDTSNLKSGIIGTIQYMIGEEVFDAIHTTPEAPEYQSLLKQMNDKGCEYVISEVSSHALSLRRTDNTVFDIAIFTNLSRDHLDFHKDMEDYFEAKKRLFLELLKKEGISIVNTDDIYGKRLVSSLHTKGFSSANIITYGLNKDAHIRAIKIKQDFSGIRFCVKYKNDVFTIESTLKGMGNVYNVLASFAAGVSLNLGVDAILSGIHRLRNVMGRFESVECGQDYLVIIDYAHTDEALRSLIMSARKIINEKSRIITVFGCGGNRDKGKRSLMGNAATSLSNFSIITSDNPRYEDPLVIIKDIEVGVSGEYLIEVNREEAIKKAISLAKKDDIVLIAGKGHESYQEIKGVRYPFSDKDVAEMFIKERMKNIGPVPHWNNGKME